MKIKNLIQYVFCLLTTACQSFLIVPDDPSYNAIFTFGEELKKTYDLRIVGFGGGSHEGKNTLNVTFMSGQTPDFNEARIIFYDVLTGFLERLNSSEKLQGLTVDNYYTMDNLNIMIMFPDVENYITTVATGTTRDRDPLQFVYFFTYNAQTGKSDITYKEPYEELKSIVEQQRCGSQCP